MEEDKVVEKFKEKMEDIVDTDKAESYVNDNKIEFEYRSIKYKVSRPTFKQKQEVSEKTIKKYTSLIQAKDENGSIYKTEEEWKKIHKERGIDIDEMDNKLKSLDKKREEIMFKLGEAIKLEKTETELDVFKEELKSLYNEQSTLFIKKTILLDSSIETLVTVYSYTYLAYLITEKFVNDVWVKYTDYDSFLNEEEGLINNIVSKTTMISKVSLPSFQ